MPEGSLGGAVLGSLELWGKLDDGPQRVSNVQEACKEPRPLSRTLVSPDPNWQLWHPSDRDRAWSLKGLGLLCVPGRELS